MPYVIKAVFTSTQIHNYSINSYFQEIRINIENPGKLFKFPGFMFLLKPSEFPVCKPMSEVTYDERNHICDYNQK